MQIPSGYFEFDYDVYRPCQRGSDCCDSICRCGKLQDVKIESFDILGVADFLKKALLDKKHKWTVVENYCFGRLFTIMKLYDPEQYEPTTSRGYYGEEIDGAYVNEWLEFEREFKKMIKLNDDDKIRFVLEKEYGYLLEELKGAQFECRSVDYTDILPPIDLRRTDGDSCDFSSAIAICKQMGDKYRILDGHHRWKNANGWKKVDIFVALGS